LGRLEQDRYKELVVPELYEADTRRKGLRAAGIDC